MRTTPNPMFQVVLGILVTICLGIGGWAVAACHENYAMIQRQDEAKIWIKEKLEDISRQLEKINNGIAEIKRGIK